jgi:hypothetical protein
MRLKVFRILVFAKIFEQNVFKNQSFSVQFVFGFLLRFSLSCMVVFGFDLLVFQLDQLLFLVLQLFVQMVNYFAQHLNSS